MTGRVPNRRGAPSLRRGVLFLRKGSYRRAYHEPRLCAHFVRAPLSKDLRLLDTRRYEHGARALDEVGREIATFQALLVASVRSGLRAIGAVRRRAIAGRSPTSQRRWTDVAHLRSRSRGDPTC